MFERGLGGRQVPHAGETRGRGGGHVGGGPDARKGRHRRPTHVAQAEEILVFIVRDQPVLLVNQRQVMEEPPEVLGVRAASRNCL